MPFIKTHYMNGGLKMKKIASVLCLILMVMALSACSTSKKELQPLTIGILPDVDSIPLMIAEQNGYFNEAGVTIKIETFQSAKDRDSALQAGKIDGAISDILAAAFAKEGGFDVKITSKTDGSYKLLVHKDKGITDIKGLKDKGVAISKNTIIEYVTDMMLEEASLKDTDIKKEIIPQMPVRLEMLQNGKVDGATLPEPLASAAISNGAKLLNSSDKLGVNPGVLLFTSKAIEAKAEEIKTFYKAYNKAVDYLKKEDKSKYIDTIIQKAAFPPVVKDTLILPAYKKAELPTEKDFTNVINWLKSKELIKNTYKFNELVTDKFTR
jgi:NitT/TauT family transport system substrate-binding protein